MSETRAKVASVGKDILITIGALGFVFVAAVAGNAVQLLKYTPLLKKTKYTNYQINRNIKRLLERGLLEIKESKQDKRLEITSKGRRLLLKYELEGLADKKPKKWDGRYRIVIFDISEHRRKTRDHLRIMLKGFGFVQLQGSVWVYPYHCQEIIELLKKYLELKSEVVYMTADLIENDDWLLENFKLKR
jgi:phenylacetic acid degradation operon negative regulatory protein